VIYLLMLVPLTRGADWYERRLKAKR
jgi:hypothetical protein